MKKRHTKPSVALVRGKFLNAYEMQTFEPLVNEFSITAFGSHTPFHDSFKFTTKKLFSPMDLPEFPMKMPVLNRIFLDAQYLYNLENALKGFDIVHTAETYYHYTHQALIAKKKGYVKKVVATVLENIPFNNEGIWGRKAFKKQAREELDCMIALTENTRQTLILEGANPEKIKVVGYGINTNKFSPAKDFVTRLKENKTINILFTGRLEVYKGIYEIVYAAKLLLEDQSLQKYRLHFTFVGEGSEKSNLVQREKELGIEKFISHLTATYDEIPTLYKKADIFLAPSKEAKYWQEQFNIALLEAQASGLPIITTYSGSIPENIGNAGILIGAGDFYALYKEIKFLLTHPQQRIILSGKARKRAVNTHDVSIKANNIKEIYQSLL